MKDFLKNAEITDMGILALFLNDAGYSWEEVNKIIEALRRGERKFGEKIVVVKSGGEE